MIVLFVKGQSLSIKQPQVVDKTVNYLEAYVKFLTKDWDGTEKYLHLEKGEDSFSFLLTEGKVTKEAGMNLPSGTWKVSIVGERYNGETLVERITTNTVEVVVEIGGSVEGDIFPEHNPSLAEQFLGKVIQQKQAAENAADDAKTHRDAAERSEEEAGNAAKEAEKSARDAAKEKEKVVEASEAEQEKIKSLTEGARQEADRAGTAAENAKQSADNAKESETGAKGSEAVAAQALTDFLHMLGHDVATLVEGKIPASQIPSIATTEIYTVTTEAERDALSVENGDICIVTYGDATLSKSFIYSNGGWVYLTSPTDYASRAGHAETATAADNAAKINGHRLVEMSAEQFRRAVKDEQTYYLVWG